MTKIDFFSNSPDRLAYVVRLIQKIRNAQQNTVVYGETDALNLLSKALWQLNGFCAHDVCHTTQTDNDLKASIVLIDNTLVSLPHHDNLINISDVTPDFFASFKRLIEIIPADGIPRQLARERWQFYKSRGYAMTHHDIAQK